MESNETEVNNYLFLNSKADTITADGTATNSNREKKLPLVELNKKIKNKSTQTNDLLVLCDK